MKRKFELAVNEVSLVSQVVDAFREEIMVTNTNDIFANKYRHLIFHLLRPIADKLILASRNGNKCTLALTPQYYIALEEALNRGHKYCKDDEVSAQFIGIIYRRLQALNQ